MIPRILIPRILVIAGSDCSGGAGIQADIKTVTMLGGYAATAVTAITVQNTLGVSAIHPIPQAIIAGQIEAVLSDIGADAIKIGMLGDAATIETVAACLAGISVPIILDPVMVAKGGAALLEEDATWALVERLLPLATLLTPNVPELETLTETHITDEADMLLAAQELLERGPKAILAKGGHLAGATVVDWLVGHTGQQRFEAPRIESRHNPAHTHGTGCTLSSAVATLLGAGQALPDAVQGARAFVRAAISAAPGFGAGHGPLGHARAVIAEGDQSSRI